MMMSQLLVPYGKISFLKLSQTESRHWLLFQVDKKPINPSIDRMLSVRGFKLLANIHFK